MKTNKYMYATILAMMMIFCINCSDDDSDMDTDDDTVDTVTDTIDDSDDGTDDDSYEDGVDTGDYTGTASVTQGIGTATTANLFDPGQRISAVGTITASDDSEWTVPAEVNYANDEFPFAPDLFNSYGGQYNSASEALADFDEDDIVEIDADGEVITAYIFGDNYFELYVNGEPVGKDAVPFTEFNSHIVKFRVSRPFTVAMKLVDWEENLGLGTETNQGSDYYPGDGGMVAVFKDDSEAIIATTGSEWKAQTFYTAPIKDLSCPTEEGTTRMTADCDTSSEADGSSFYGLHWELPETWMEEGFDASGWPDATTYTNETIVVNNKQSYTNFTDVFDDPAEDAEFIWSTNVVLDNEVIVRYTVE